MPDPHVPEATVNEWTLEGIPVKTRHGRAVPSGCYPVQGRGSYIQPGERVVVERPSDTARKIAEGLREQRARAEANPLQQWDDASWSWADALTAAANWVESEFGGSG